MSTRKYRVWDTECLKVEVVTMSLEELAAKYQVSRDAMRLALTSRKIVYRSTTARPSLTSRELEFIKATYQFLSVKDLARTLGVKERTVASALHKHRLVKQVRTKVSRPWTQEELNTLIFKSERMSLQQLADAVGRPYHAVRKQLIKMDIKPLCGVFSLKQACDVTGYTDRQLKRAKVGLQQDWRKAGHRVVISEKQLRILCDWLKNEGNPNYVPPTKTAELEDDYDFLEKVA